MLSQKLTPTFCMEDMDTLDMPATMDIPMVDMPTMDKLFPLISKWTANHPCFLYCRVGSCAQQRERER